MKKRYLTPTIDFEVLEEEDILAASGKAEYDIGETKIDDYETNEETGGIGVGDDNFWIE